MSTETSPHAHQNVVLVNAWDGRTIAGCRGCGMTLADQDRERDVAVRAAMEAIALDAYLESRAFRSIHARSEARAAYLAGFASARAGFEQAGLCAGATTRAQEEQAYLRDLRGRA